MITGGLREEESCFKLERQLNVEIPSLTTRSCPPRQGLIGESQTSMSDDRIKNARWTMCFADSFPASDPPSWTPGVTRHPVATLPDSHSGRR